MERRIDLRLRISYEPRVVRPWLALGLILLSAGELGSENVTLTTYYPAPSGMYAQMIVTGNTWLARNSGNVGIGTGAAAVTQRLQVNGGRAQFAGDTAGFVEIYNVGGAGEGGTIRLVSNEGVNQFIENAGGRIRFVNSAWSQELLSITNNGSLHIATAWTCGSVRNFTTGAACGVNTEYATFTPGLYAEGWTYQNRGGAVQVESQTGAISTQVWALDNGPGGSGNPRWMTLRKDDSTTQGYCCTR